MQHLHSAVIGADYSKHWRYNGTALYCRNSIIIIIITLDNHDPEGGLKLENIEKVGYV